MDIISNKTKELSPYNYKDMGEMNFFCEHEQIIFYLDKFKKAYLDGLDLKPISLDILFILCHRAYYKDEKFDDLYEKITQNKQLIIDIITSSTCRLDLLDGIWFDKPFKFYYKMANDKLENSIFDNENYIKTIKKILNFLYAYNNDFNKAFFESVYSDMLKNNKKIKRDMFDKINNDFQKKLWRELGVSKLCNDIYNHYTQLVQNYNKFLSNTKTKYFAYMTLMNNLQHIEKLPYVVDINLTKNIDEETFFSLYRYATEVNQSFCKGLFKEREDLLQDSLKNKKLQLKKCGYDIDRIPPSKLHFLLKYADINELEKIITFLNKLDYSIVDIYSDNGIYILANTTYEIIININKLLVTNVINQNFLNQYPQSFFSKDIINNVEGLYEKIASNINVLSENYRIDNSYLNELALTDYDLLANNINILKKYNQNFNKDILNNIKLLDYLDLFIELGFSNYIKESCPNINESSYIVFKRCYVSKLINFQSKDLKNRIEAGIDFYINDSDLDEFIINNVDEYLEKDIKSVLDNNPRNIINDNELKQFDNYSKDNLTYDFNGILISKNKVLRNLNCLENSNLDYRYEDLLFSSIIYGSILDYEQIEVLKDVIYNQKIYKKIDK